MVDIRERLLAIFAEEAKDHVGALRAFLASLPGDSPPSAKAIDDARRAAHTLKGAARAVTMDGVQDVAYGLERMLAGAGKDEFELTDELVELAREAVDSISSLVSESLAGNSPDKPTGLLQRLERVFASEETEGDSAGAQPAAEPRAAARQSPADHLMAVFRDECAEHLSAIRRFIDGLRAGESFGQSAIDDIFRDAHSLKGAARAVNMRRVAEVSHVVEHLFARAREGADVMTAAALEAVSGALDAIEDCVVSGESHGAASVRSAVSRIHACLGEDLPADGEEIPAVAAYEEEQSLPAQAAAVQDQKGQTVRVHIDSLDRLQESAGELLAETFRQEAVSARVAGIEARLKGMTRDWSRLMNKSVASMHRLEMQPEFRPIVRSIDAIRHETSVIAAQTRQLRREQTAAARATSSLAHRVLREAQDARMIPAEEVFRVFRKMVRDLAAEQGKQIEFRADGMDVRADRLVLQALKDPLMHVLRNAVSHGIEVPAKRSEAGKKEKGEVRLQLLHKGNRLQVRVSDDGAGVDRAAILEAAVAAGRFASDEAAELGSEETMRLLFEAGFTTAGALTAISGRGMGLSTVHEAARRFQGHAAVESDGRTGTTVLIDVPIALSTHTLLMVRAGGQVYGLPAHGVDRLARASRSEIRKLQGEPTLEVNDRTLALTELSSVLGLPPTDTAGNGFVTIVALKAGDRGKAMIVDEVLALRRVVLADMPAPISREKRIVGGFVEADGSVCTVLDTTALVEEDGGWEPVSAVPPIETPLGPSKEDAPQEILVVDDSITTRTLEKTILEAHGYNVRVAVNGNEGLKVLRSRDVDLVITDVDMPELDGFGLLSQMKADEKLKLIPVIIVSSMAKDSDREKGLELGADAYIIKQKFEQQELLRTIRQIL